MKHLLLTIFLPITALALDPSQPVVRLDYSGQIVERKQSIPARFANVVNYQSAEYRWFADGWRQASISYVTNVVTTQIPAPIQAVAASYKASMESIYGEGAVTNRTLTREAVAIDLSLRPSGEVSAETGIRLQTWFEIINGYWARDEVWTFPYNSASYSSTNISEEWSVVAP